MKGRKKKVGGIRKDPPSPHDLADRQALDRAVETMIQRVLNGWDHNRSLASLNRDDLTRIADAAITGWVLERVELAKCNSEIKGQLHSTVLFAG